MNNQKKTNNNIYLLLLLLLITIHHYFNYNFVSPTLYMHVIHVSSYHLDTLNHHLGEKSTRCSVVHARNTNPILHTSFAR